MQASRRKMLDRPVKQVIPTMKAKLDVHRVCIVESIKGMGRDVVFVDGVRTPFLTSFTSYKDLMGYQLARHALLYGLPVVS